MNRIQLIGRVGRRITYHCTTEGKDLVRFKLTTNATDHYCTCWGIAALALHRDLDPDDRLMVSGELSYRKRWTAEGVEVSVADIIVKGYLHLD